MRTLNQSGYLRQGIRPRKFVRVSDSSTGETILLYGSAEHAGYEDRIETFGTVTQSIRPDGGLAEVSGVEIGGLILDDRLTLCREASVGPKLDGALMGAGRLLSASQGSYYEARNAQSADWATPAIVAGRNYSAGSDIHTVYRGLMEFEIPAGVKTCEDAYIELAGLGLSAPSAVRFWLAGGTWSGLSQGGDMFNDFAGWLPAGNYGLTVYNEAWTAGEYFAVAGAVTSRPLVRIRLNAAGRAAVAANTGGSVKFILISERDANYTLYQGGASGPEFVMFESGSARLKIRYNSMSLDNQVVEIFYALADSTGGMPAVISAETCDLVWSGVVDSYAVNGRRLSLTCRQNDFKKNRMAPSKLITTGEWPNCPEANIGKAVPVVYGRFDLSGEHRAGVGAYAGVTPSGASGYYSYPDCLRGLVVSRDGDKRTVLFARHYLKDYLTSNLLFVWNGQTKAYEALPCAATQVSDAHGHSRVISPVWSTAIPRAFCEGKLRAAGTVLPDGHVNGGATNPAAAYDADTGTFAELASGQYIEFLFTKQQGNDGMGIAAFVAYAEFTGGAIPGGLRLQLYRDQRSTVTAEPNWVLTDVELTPWSGDDQIALAFYDVDDTTGYRRTAIQLGQYKLRLEKTDVFGVAKLSDVCAMVSRDVPDETEIYTHGRGRRDDVYGSVTGTGYGLIENPAHVIEAFGRNEMALDATEIDLGAFDAAAAKLTGSKFAFQLTDRERSRGLLDALGEQARCMLWWDERDRLTVRVLDGAAGFPHSGTGNPGALDTFSRTGDPSGGSFTRHPIMSDVEIEVIGMDEVKNDFVIRYKKNMASGEYEGALTCDKDGCADETGFDGVTDADLTALCEASYDRVRTVNTEEIEAWAIRDRATAARLLQHLVEWKSRRRYRVEFTAGLSALECEFGDFYSIRHERLDDLFGVEAARRKRWMIVGKDVNLDGDVVQMRLIEI